MAKRTRLRVVIDRHTNGELTIYADAGVDVFERFMHEADSPLLQFLPLPIPPAWFTSSAGNNSRAFEQLCAMRYRVIRRH